MTARATLAAGRLREDMPLNFTNSRGLQGRIVMQLVENGAYINGQVETRMGVFPFEMMPRT